jgi:predicted metal-dependent HD superfamily phosphohydrolase
MGKRDRLKKRHPEIEQTILNILLTMTSDKECVLHPTMAKEILKDIIDHMSNKNILKDYRTFSNTQEILFNEEFIAAYDWAMENNTGKDHPYHNNRHLRAVTFTAIQGATSEGMDTNTIRNVALAAIFHDMDHKGTPGDDDINIENAINAFTTYNNRTGLCGPEDTRKITELIQATRYPYITPAEDLTPAQCVLRDADILQGHLCSDYINLLVYPLFTEMNKGTEKTMIEQLTSQIGFIESMSFITPWAKNIHEKHKQRLIDAVTGEIKSLTENWNTLYGI